MAHVLIGWELGANRGHALRMHRLGVALREAGHSVTFAIQRIDALTPAEAGPSPVWQAPLTPRLLLSGSRTGAATMGMADILARLGFDDGAIIAAMLNAWEQMLLAIRPDVVIGEYAPFLLLAARGRLPTMLIGTAFSQPPSQMPELPSLAKGSGAVDQVAMIEGINAAAVPCGARPIAALPQLFDADVMVADSFTELDAYAAHRLLPLANPLPATFSARAGSGEEVFVYVPERVAIDSPLWRGLAASGLPVRIFPLRATAAMVEMLTGLGFKVEPRALDFATIAERSRMTVSHGGHGFVCASMAAGLPQVVCHFDLEKILHGLAIAREGLGGHVSLSNLDPAEFGADLARLYADEALTGRARAKAEDVRQRQQPDATAVPVAAMASLT